MKCKKCGEQMRVLTYSPLLLTLSNHNEAKRTVRGVCDSCGNSDKWKEIFTLSSTEEFSEEGIFFI